jgi:uncharacterized repeat protein (TIGR03803 family)
MTPRSIPADPNFSNPKENPAGKITRIKQICALALVAFALAATRPALAQTYNVLYTFTGGTDGGAPFATLISDSSGNFYGTTKQGGDPSCSCGVVFKMDSTGAETVLHTFVGTDGSTPLAPLTLDSQGNLYGTTSTGGAGAHGVVFKLESSGTYKILHAFTGTIDGGDPQGVTLDGSGNIYGVSNSGGPNNSNNCNFGCGTLWKLSPPGKLTILHNFAGGTDGYAPVGLVYLDSQGTLYGATTYGGSANNNGTVYAYTRNGVYSLNVLTGPPGPSHPQGGFIRDASGNFYNSAGGGTIGDGSVFRMNAALNITGTFSFTGTNGQNPNGGLILDSAGNVYGTTYDGGSSGWGAVFEISSTSESVLHSFDLPADGQNPAAGMTMDSLGNLYGTTFHGGGTSNYGVVFEITP